MPPYENPESVTTTAAANPRVTRSFSTRASTTTAAGQPLPPQREVAAGMVNLGNTCYMNCVLEVLAHAPELCLSLDCEPHHTRCPIAQAKARKQRASPSPDDTASNLPALVVNKATRKSRRSNGGKRSPNLDGTCTNSDEDDAPSSKGTAPSDDFCALCEVENLLEQVHASQTDAVAPSDFVHGFIGHVAPWFKLGVQEDSHEFLRLLIDAMQKSCTRARPQDEPEEDSEQDQVEKEYPFKLFRGTIQSNVTCDACQASSSKIDPIEDIGLEVQGLSTAGSDSASVASGGKALTNVNSAFQRLVHAEPLDAYKCEKCGKLGRATKQSRLASIPPILTLHLKRFRYGSDGPVAAGTAVRGGRSEVSQLLSSQQPSDLLAGAFGKSGSAKIEGHIQFEQVLDLKPFLTPELQERHQNMFTRLFAVIVHAGKNSHSGHYVAYVRNIIKNEWWKMDDARVTKVSIDEVRNAEAYMLFYRAIEHPVAVQLREAYKVKVEEQESQQKQEQELEEEPANVVEVAAAAPTEAISSARPENKKRKRGPPTYTSGEDWARAKTRLSPGSISLIRRAEDFLSENVELKPEVFHRIAQDASQGKSGPSGVCAEDIQGEPDRFRKGIKELLFNLCSSTSKEGASFFKRLTSSEDKKPAVVEDDEEVTETGNAGASSSKNARELLIPPPVVDPSDAVL